MGLHIVKQHPRYGLDLDYWKVGQVKIDWHTQVCRVQLLGFVNQTQRDAGKDAVQRVDFGFEGASFTFTHETGIVDQIYAAIKLHDDWAAAEDVL